MKALRVDRIDKKKRRLLNYFSVDIKSNVFPINNKFP